MKRGEVYLVYVGRADDPRAIRQDIEGPLIPAVILTRDALNLYSATMVVAPIVDAEVVPHLYPSDVRVAAPEGGLTVDGVILTAQVRSVPTPTLEPPIRCAEHASS